MTAASRSAGEASTEAQTLSRVARESLMAGLAQIKAGNTFLDIAGAVEDHKRANGFRVVEDYTGHGVAGIARRTPVFNFRTDEPPNLTLRPGMTLAVEPILNAGSLSDAQAPDGGRVTGRCPLSEYRFW